MSSRSIFSKTADVLQRGAVLGLLSAFGFQCYQIVTKTWEGQVDSPHMHSTYLKDVEEKVREEYQNDNQIDKREWYQPDDDSHLKNQVKANTAVRK
mmetsp:Transcript_9707/g.18581  ORF Transcript_9707/g.18581 Transcript_9707/m.18581 type:complete len:96 (-) Transcript_9707:45-332(-)